MLSRQDIWPKYIRVSEYINMQGDDAIMNVTHKVYPIHTVRICLRAYDAQDL